MAAPTWNFPGKENRPNYYPPGDHWEEKKTRRCHRSVCDVMPRLQDIAGDLYVDDQAADR